MGVMIFLIVFFGIFLLAYLNWRLNQVNDSAEFLRERFFSPLAGVLALFLVSLIIVNGFFGNSKKKNTPNNKWHQVQPADINYEHVDSHTQLLKHHIRKKSKQQLTQDAFQEDQVFEHYRELAQSGDQRKSSLGNYYLGIGYLVAEHFDQAKQKFDKVSKTNLPSINHYKGKVNYFLDNDEAAKKYLRKAVEANHEKSLESTELLYHFYKENHSDKALADFVSECEYLSALPLYEARYKAFQFGYLGTYTSILLFTVWETFTLKTLTVAFLVACVWIFFLFRLTLKKWKRPLYYLTIFGLGALFSLAVFYLSDSLHYFADFRMNDMVWNDLLYSIVGIGLVEEIVKIIPLLLFLRFTSIIQEPYDYLLVAGLSALGFAFLENVQYFNEGLSGVVSGRTLTATLLHMVLSSMVAYGIILGHYHKSRLPTWLLFVLHLALAAILHGFYDFFIFHGGALLGLLNLGLFIFYVRVWTVMLNNCINCSSTFNYKNNIFYDNLRFYVIVILSGIFFLDYCFTGWQSGAFVANDHLWGNMVSGGLLILVLATNLSRFDLVPNYWRRIQVFTENLPKLKKREDFSGGYEEHYLNKADPKKSMFGNLDPGLLGGMPNLISANLVYPKNFINRRVSIDKFAHNKRLKGIVEETLYGSFIKRLIVSYANAEDPSTEGDPDWFLLELEEPITVRGVSISQFLVKFKSKNPALRYDKDLMALLCLPETDKNPQSDPIHWEGMSNYGWVMVNKAPL